MTGDSSIETNRPRSLLAVSWACPGWVLNQTGLAFIALFVLVTLVPVIT
jgi:hypothetical protein